MRRIRIAFGALAGILALLLVAGWWQQEALWVWWESPSWVAADEGRTDRVIEQMESRPQGWRPLLGQLQFGDTVRCAGCGRVLEAWMTRQPPGQTMQEFYSDLATSYGTASSAGQAQMLRLLFLGLRKPNGTSEAELLQLAAQVADKTSPAADDRLVPLLQLLSVLLETSVADSVSHCSRQATKVALQTDGEAREMAVRLAVHRHVGQPEALVPLISSNTTAPAAIQALVLLALGDQEALLPAERVLPFLHHGEESVRSMAEQVLRTRGLTPAQVRLGRLVTHHHPAERARVLVELTSVPEVDDRVWVDRLSQDPSPVVRAAVVRYAQRRTDGPWGEFQRRTANGDPSETVRQLAQQAIRRTR